MKPGNICLVKPCGTIEFGRRWFFESNDLLAPVVQRAAAPRRAIAPGPPPLLHRQRLGTSLSADCAKRHTVDYAPFITSQLAFARSTSGPIWSRTPPESGGDEALKGHRVDGPFTTDSRDRWRDAAPRREIAPGPPAPLGWQRLGTAGGFTRPREIHFSGLPRLEKP